MEKQVFELLYGDNNTRLFTYWTVSFLIFDFPASTSHVYIYCFIFEKRLFKKKKKISSLQDDFYRNTGCYNLMCPGFVQVDNQIAMGATVTPSIYGGTQRSVKFNVWKVVQYFNLITLSNTLLFGYT